MKKTKDAGKYDDDLSQLTSENQRLKRLINDLHNRSSEQLTLISSLQDEIQRMRLKNRLKRLIRRFVPHVSLAMFLHSMKMIYGVLFYIPRSLKKHNIIRWLSSKPIDFEPGPSVSVLILNRNGHKHLKRLFRSIKRYDTYRNVTYHIWDNGSTDGSVAFLQTLNLPIQVYSSERNLSFSEANNLLASKGTSDFLLFLNNDISVTPFWIERLISTYQRSGKSCGTVGATLLYPNGLMSKALKIQHEGIGFLGEMGFFRPKNLRNGDTFLIPQEERIQSFHAVTGAVCLVSREDFELVDGFTESYEYGYEDVDLGLKLFEKGKYAFTSNHSVLFHHEFGTQNKQPIEEVARRRVQNKKVFERRWYRWLLNDYWRSKINGQGISWSSMHVVFVVSETGTSASAGDYFTAKELAGELTKFGWICSFKVIKPDGTIDRLRGDEDVVIVMLHQFRLDKLKRVNPNLLVIGWMRNWFDHFINSPWLPKYDALMSSSKMAIEILEKQHSRSALYFPIASNSLAFDQSASSQHSDFVCDYCFTGSFWNEPRQIMKCLEPADLPEFKFHLYGKNWDQVDQFRPYNRGFIEYELLPLVYRNTKLVIDDANRVTKNWGSVNSRVFDALVSGALVLTNSESGSKELFNGELPVYSSKKELHGLIVHYLTHEKERLEKVSRLRKMVLKSHSYTLRADTLKQFLSTYFKRSIRIKVPVPNEVEAKEWGDYHFARSLSKALEREGYHARLDFLNQWNESTGNMSENVVVIRGLSVYEPKPFQVNFVWIISHPTSPTYDELEEYDHVLVASEFFKQQLSEALRTPVSVALQCSDIELFQPVSGPKHARGLYVANSRGTSRKVMEVSRDLELPMDVFGRGWSDPHDTRRLKGLYIPNDELYQYYGRYGVILNDHWEDMRAYGFLSNRIFDALACNGVVLSDKVAGVEDIPGVEWFESKGEFVTKFNQLIEVADRHETRSYVEEAHTFNHRARQIISTLDRITSSVSK